MIFRRNNLEAVYRMDQRGSRLKDFWGMLKLASENALEIEMKKG